LRTPRSPCIRPLAPLARPPRTVGACGFEVPTLVVHGRRDPFFPVGHGEAIAREVPGARLLVLEEAATAIPEAAAGQVVEAMLALG
jgi:pimeloyl-ACP methyl ester carboxylesterase